MLNIGFTGSRERYWSNLDKVDDLIAKILFVNGQRCEWKDIHVHVGDANGVDELVVHWCLHYDLPVTVYGINGEWRNVNVPQEAFQQYDIKLFFNQTDYPIKKQAYAIRDKKVVDAVDKLYAIWDGGSPGTKLTFEYARKQGKKVHLAQLVIEEDVEKWVWS